MAALARSSLASDLDTLRRVWARRGGSYRGYIGGSIEVATAGGHGIVRSTRSAIEAWLRQQLERVA